MGSESGSLRAPEQTARDAGVTWGYTKPLAVMAFDHRTTFARLLGATWPLSETHLEKARCLKRVILEGLTGALEEAPWIEGAAALVDEEIAGDLAKTVRERRLLLAMPAEATASDALDFAYGDQFAEHIERFKPDLIKVLLRRNPRFASPALATEDERLLRLTDWARAHAYPVMLELVVPPDASSTQSPASLERFEREVRPDLMAEVMIHLQDRGVEPDVWKLEGLDVTDSCAAVARVAQRDGRSRVRCIVLGRGAEMTKVLDWLRAAREVPAYSGFAIGRSLWWGPLRSLAGDQIGEKQAADLISANYLAAYRAFFEGRPVSVE